MLSAKTIKAPITYKALIGGGANNSDKKGKKKDVFWTQQLIQKYRWKYHNKVNMQECFNEEKDKVDEIKIAIRQMREAMFAAQKIGD